VHENERLIRSLYEALARRDGEAMAGCYAPGEAVADEASGHADRQAWYPFSGTGREVHNVVQSEFRFRDGRIAAQVDDFDLWRWSRQALGPVGLLLGWSPLLRRRLRATAAAQLARPRALR
jgi:ketosteroid isomerase-like protein